MFDLNIAIADVDRNSYNGSKAIRGYTGRELDMGKLTHVDKLIYIPRGVPVSFLQNGKYLLYSRGMKFEDLIIQDLAPNEMYDIQNYHTGDVVSDIGVTQSIKLNQENRDDLICEIFRRDFKISQEESLLRLVVEKMIKRTPVKKTHLTTILLPKEYLRDYVLDHHYIADNIYQHRDDLNDTYHVHNSFSLSEFADIKCCMFCGYEVRLVFVEDDKDIELLLFFTPNQDVTMDEFRDFILDNVVQKHYRYSKENFKFGTPPQKFKRYVAKGTPLNGVEWTLQDLKDFELFLVDAIKRNAGGFDRREECREVVLEMLEEVLADPRSPVRQGISLEESPFDLYYIQACIDGR